MNRRGFMKLIAGGAAAFRALGLPISKPELVSPVSPSYLDAINWTLAKSQYKAYESADLGEWTLEILSETKMYDARGGTLIPIDLKRTPI